jgi:PAT family acetyl-CoA transporter-like MFS transporter 1
MKRRNGSNLESEHGERTLQEVQVNWGESTSSFDDDDASTDNDRFNYALLIVLYTLQGIPMGLSASIPFLLQEKITKMSQLSQLAASASSTAAAAGASAASIQAASYNANAVFALCSWPFSLKLLWAPIVDAVYFKRFGRRKSWLVPVQMMAGCLMWGRRTVGARRDCCNK